MHADEVFEALVYLVLFLWLPVQLVLEDIFMLELMKFFLISNFLSPSMVPRAEGTHTYTRKVHVMYVCTHIQYIYIYKSTSGGYISFF